MGWLLIRRGRSDLPEPLNQTVRCLGWFTYNVYRRAKKNLNLFCEAGVGLFCVGLNYKMASVEARERFAVSDLPSALIQMKSQPGIAECVLLSTCNRTEWIIEADDAAPVLSWFHALNQGAPPLYCLEGLSATQHIMQVAVGLDSMMLGETQILGQLKDAVSVAQAEGTLGPVLSRLSQMTFQAAKKARHETNINAHAVSVAGAAVRLGSQIFASLAETRVLLLGAGETIAEVATHLASRGCHSFTIASRKIDRAEALAERFQATALSLNQVHDVLPQADIVITATRSTLPILGKGAIERAIKLRKHKPMLLIDLGVPRDIEAEVQNLADVYLYNIDDLANMVMESKVARQMAGTLAESLLKQKAHTYMKWYRTRDVSRLIAAYRLHADEVQNTIAAEAVAMLQAGTPAETVLLWQARALTQKLLHLPTERLKAVEWADDPTLLERMVSIFKHS